MMDQADVRPPSNPTVDATARYIQNLQKREELRRRRAEFRVKIVQRGKEDCCPTLEIHRSDIPYIASHIVLAQTTRMKPVLLHRGFGTEEFRNLQRNESLSVFNQSNLGPPPESMPTPSIDEYPFASSMEGGDGASLAWVPLDENRKQGNRISRFFQDKNVAIGGCFFVSVVP
jgi:hypothetical protein